YLIIDLEATCSNDKSIRSNQMEMIEIGAVMLNTYTWEIDAEFQQFIQPIINPILTNFCTELTSITQKDIDTAPKFPEAMSNFKEWLISFPDYIFCSWGEYDRRQFRQDCKLHNLENPFSEHINIKKKFSEYLKTSRPFGMKGALDYLGMELKGRHHRGIDDARNIAAIYKYMHTHNK
ncbi:MAG: 3'-5' exonuclease, partial [Cyanobacteria bacterium P01_A01_bin.84]